MKRFFSVLVVSAVMLMFASSAYALSFNITGVGGGWSNAVGGTNVGTSSVGIGYGNGTEDQVRWGTTTGGPQSGLGFAGIAASGGSPVSVDVDNVFEVGQLQHLNRPIAVGSSASAVDLTITLGFQEAISPPSPISFTFTFEIDETHNVEPCAYPGSTVCPDKITFPSSLPTQNFSFGGKFYTLELVGFASALGGLGSPENEFFSDEGADNDTLLFAKITERTVPMIPEPTTMLLLGGGLLGLAGFRKKKK